MFVVSGYCCDMDMFVVTGRLATVVMCVLQALLPAAALWSEHSTRVSSNKYKQTTSLFSSLLSLLFLFLSDKTSYDICPIKIISKGELQVSSTTECECQINVI